MMIGIRRHRLDDRGLAPARGLALVLAGLIGLGAGAPVELPDLEERLVALTPSEPRGYFELAEEIVEESRAREDVALARRLFGLAGRLDPERFAASSLLALAELRSEPGASELRAAAEMLLGDSGRRRVGRGGRVDAETALAISEAFGAFGAGRFVPLRRLLQDASVRRILEEREAVLPNGVAWFEQTVRDRPQAGLLLEPQRLALLHLELSLLEPGGSDWSTILVIGGDRPLLELDVDGLERLLLDEERLRPLYRDGRWVERSTPPAAKPPERR